MSIIKDADGRWLVYLPDFETDDTVPTYLNQGDYLVQMDHDGHWEVVSRDDFVMDYQEIKYGVCLNRKRGKIMFYVECPDCDCRLNDNLAWYVCPQYGMEWD